MCAGSLTVKEFFFKNFRKGKRGKTKWRKRKKERERERERERVSE